MKMAIVAGLAVVALLGVGVVAASVAMAPGGMGGMMGGDMQGMHDQMQGMDHDGMHDQCLCCGDDPND
jgi:Spy/CpxP family protein refolding chaperone